MPSRRERAEKTVVGIIKRIGYAEALWVAEHLAWENEVQWWDSRLIIRLSDMQLVAFAAAIRAHYEAIYPSMKKKDEPTRGADGNVKPTDQTEEAEPKPKKRKKARFRL